VAKIMQWTNEGLYHTQAVPQDHPQGSSASFCQKGSRHVLGGEYYNVEAEETEDELDRHVQSTDQPQILTLLCNVDRDVHSIVIMKHDSSWTK